MYGYIYKTTNLIDNKIYVGQHKANNDQFDSTYFGSGKLLFEAINKYGIDNFKCEILEWCETFEELNEKEIFWIKELHATERDIGYNICTGGQGIPGLFGELNPNYGKVFSEEHRRHLSESHIGVQAGEKHPMYGKHHTEESNLKNSLAHRGENNPNYGKHLSEETKNKIGASNKLIPKEKRAMYGKHHKEDSKRKILDSNPQKRKVINIDTNEIYISIGQASRDTGIFSSSICFCCKGKYKTAGGYHWQYYDEINIDKNKL